MNRRALLTLALLLLAAGCGDDSEQPRDAAPDGAPADAAPDGAPADAGPGDGKDEDAGGFDAGSDDAGPGDAGRDAAADAALPPPPCRIATPLLVAEQVGERSSVLWHDGELWVFHIDGPSGDASLHQSRFSPTGVTTLAPTPLDLGADPTNSAYPFAVLAGDGAGLAWTNGSGTAYFALLDAAGGRLTSPVEVGTPIYSVSAVRTDGGYAAASIDGTTASLARVDADGNLLDPTTTLGETPRNPRDPVALAASDAEIAAAWFQDGDILLTRVGLDGTRLIEPATIGTVGATSSVSPPALIWTGSEYVAAWISRETDARYRDSVVVRRVAPNGTPIGDPEVLITYPDVATTGEVGAHVDVGFDGTRLAVSWVDPEGAIRLMRLDPELTAVGEPVQVTDPSYHARRPRLLSTGEEWVVHLLSDPPREPEDAYVVSVCE